MICTWCRLPMFDSKECAYPLLNDRPCAYVEAPGSTELLILHRACWEKIQRLKERVLRHG